MNKLGLTWFLSETESIETDSAPLRQICRRGRFYLFRILIYIEQSLPDTSKENYPQGKSEEVTDYVTVTPTYDGSNEATVTLYDDKIEIQFNAPINISPDDESRRGFSLCSKTVKLSFKVPFRANLAKYEFEVEIYL